jgi:hypothetical protein
MVWMTVKDASELWDICGRRVQVLCADGKVRDAERLGNMWVISKNIPKKFDERTKAAKSAKISRE